MTAASAALSTITRALNELSRVPSRAAAGACTRIEGLIQREFDAGTDPYDNAWAPLSPATVALGRSDPPLTDSGALRDIKVTPARGSGINVALGEDYGAFHQTGTRNMPARPILPTGPLPTSWREAIDEAMTEAFSKTLGGR